MSAIWRAIMPLVLPALAAGPLHAWGSAAPGDSLGRPAADTLSVAWRFDTGG